MAKMEIKVLEIRVLPPCSKSMQAFADVQLGDLEEFVSKNVANAKEEG